MKALYRAPPDRTRRRKSRPFFFLERKGRGFLSCQSGARAWISPRWTSPGSGIRNNLPPPPVGSFLFSRPCPNPCSEGHFSCLDSPFSLSPPLEAPKRRLFRLRFRGYRCVLLTILIKTGASSFDVPFLIKFVRYLIKFFRHFGGRYISSWRE